MLKYDLDIKKITMQPNAHFKDQFVNSALAIKKFVVRKPKMKKKMQTEAGQLFVLSCQRLALAL